MPVLLLLSAGTLSLFAVIFAVQWFRFRERTYEQKTRFWILLTVGSVLMSMGLAGATFSQAGDSELILSFSFSLILVGILSWITGFVRTISLISEMPPQP